MAREPHGVLPGGILVETDDDCPPDTIYLIPANSVYEVDECDPFGLLDGEADSAPE